MIKRILLCFIFGASIIVLTLTSGCSFPKKELVFDNISERCDVYFSGEGSFVANISSGYREDPYIYNGISEKNIPFSILTLITDTQEPNIEASIIINNECINVILELDQLTGNYLADFCRIINENDEIFVAYKEDNIELICESKKFGISSLQAIDIGVNAFKNELIDFVIKDKIEAEGYLRVLDDVNDKFDRTFWYFSIYTKGGKNFYCVIDVDEGHVLVKK